MSIVMASQRYKVPHQLEVSEELSIPTLSNTTTPPSFPLLPAIAYFNGQLYYWSVFTQTWILLGLNVPEISVVTLQTVAGTAYIREGNRLRGIYSKDNVARSYTKITKGPDTNNMSDTFVDGFYYIKLLSGEYFEANISGPLCVAMFGAVGNAFFRNSSGDLFQDPDFAIAATDDTAALQKAINVAVWTGKELILEQKDYQVTNTLTIPGPPASNNYIRNFRLTGMGTSDHCRIRFKNTVPDKSLLSFSSGQSYMVINGVGFRDELLYTSTLVKFTSTLNASALTPLWKVHFNDFRIEGFKLGIWFYGDADYTKDSFLSEFTFSHGKFRENVTGVIYENAQAVNHMFINVDFENGSATDISQKFKMFHIKRGTQINHVGGSVIGAGAYVYVEMLQANHFQVSTRFSSIGVRMEQREINTPVIYHAESSTISVQNAYRVDLTNFSINNQANPVNGDDIIAKLGGCIYLTLNNVRTTRTMYVYGTITANLVSSLRTGGVKVSNSNVIAYKRYLPPTNEYGSAAAAATSLMNIPCSIDNRSEGVTAQSVSGYTVFNNTRIDVLTAGFNSVDSKTVTYQASTTAGFLSGNPAEIKFILPQFARPYKITILKKGTNAGAPQIFTFNIEIGGVLYPAAVIDTTSFNGAAETMLIPPVAVDELYVDGTIWDGKCSIVKTNSATAFTGQIIIHYI